MPSKRTIPRTCQRPECGKEFLATPTSVKYGFARYCCRTCASFFKHGAPEERNICTTCKQAQRNSYSPECLKCASARVMKWARNNKDRTNDAARKYHSANIAIRNEQSRSYRQKMTDASSAGRIATEKQCKDCGIVKPPDDFPKCKFLADGRTNECRVCQNKRRRNWRDGRRSRERELGRIQKRKNPERGREAARRRRTRKIPGSHTNGEWYALCREFADRCVRCGAGGELTRDHIIPITVAGATDCISNIQPLCRPCNSSKNNCHATDYRQTPFTNKGQRVAQTSRQKRGGKRTAAPVLS